MRALATLVAFVSLAGASVSPALAAGPTILVLPSSVAQGSTANVYGTGFCPSSSGCSPVSIAVEGQQVASGVPVTSDGKFHGTFQVSQFPGTYHVTASQTAADGSTIQSPATGMIVQLNDSRTSPPPGGGNVNPPPTAQPEASQPVSSGGGASPSPVADTSPAPRAGATSVPGAPLRPATAAVSPFPYFGLAVVLLLVLAAVALAAVWWWRRRESA